MLDQLLKMAEGPLEEMQKGMSHTQPETTAAILKESIVSSLQHRTASGDVNGIKEFFSGRETSPNTPVVNNLQTEVSQNLMDKLGISKVQAMGIAAAALPMIMNFFNKRVNDSPQDNNESMSSIISSMQGEKSTINSTDLLGSLVGSASGGKGGMDIGGLIDLGKGLFK